MYYPYQKIILTGAASGIGKALLSKLSSYDIRIIAVDKNKAVLEKTVRNLPNERNNIFMFPCDLSRYQEVDGLFEFAVEKLGGIDLFIANAGFGYIEKMETPDWEHIETIFKTNAFSPIYSLIKMKRMNPSSDYAVVITSSLVGRLGLKGYALYGATKAALDRFAECYRLEMGANVKLSLVYPLTVKSKFFREAGNAPVPFPSQNADSLADRIIEGIKAGRKNIYGSPLIAALLCINHIFPIVKKCYQFIEAIRFDKWNNNKR